MSCRFSLWELVFPPVDADAGVNKKAEEKSNVSVENKANDSDTNDSSSDVDSKKKAKKEKIGFRDRKVRIDA